MNFKPDSYQKALAVYAHITMPDDLIEFHATLCKVVNILRDTDISDASIVRLHEGIKFDPDSGDDVKVLFITYCWQNINAYYTTDIPLSIINSPDLQKLATEKARQDRIDYLNSEIFQLTHTASRINYSINELESELANISTE